MTVRPSEVLRHVEHRPYPVPDRPWALRMRWCDLLFAHWPVDPAELLRSPLPAGLELDLFDGEAWVGIVPFRMTDTAPRGIPALPSRPSRFLELNVRTYVRHEGRAGVWFYSLDADSPLAVRAARWSFQLPYHDARMTLRTDETSAWRQFRSERTHRDVPPGDFIGRYRPGAALPPTAPGSLVHWLTERYFLATAARSGALRIGEIHHAQWPLYDAEAEIERCTVADAFGITLPERAPLLHFAPELDVVAWLLESP